MYTKILIFMLLFAANCAFAQEAVPTPKQQETLFRNAHIRGGFGGPIFSWSDTKDHTGYGAGGGGGVVFDRFFVGLFGMGETFGRPLVGTSQLALGYGGLWVGYTVPSHKLLHFYTSAKVAIGSVGITDFKDDWEFEDYWPDLTFVAIPEAGVEVNIARWFRLSGSVGYRFVEGFEGWGSYGKHDLNAPVYNLTLRFGKFGK